MALRLRDLSVEFRPRTGVVRAVDGLSLDIPTGARLGLVGESGSGKTTTAMALMGMIRAPGHVVGGVATLDVPGGNGGATAIDLLGLTQAQMRAARLRVVSYIPQGAMNSLNPVITIGAAFREGFVDHGVALGSAALRDRIAGLLDLVGLPPQTAARYPHELSGGMKQRVCIALAVALDPALIIADEPTSALDVVTQRQVMATLQAVQEKANSSLLMIGHDMGLMAQFVHDLAVMRDGKMVEIGNLRQTFRAPNSDYTRHLIESVPVLGAARSAPVAPAHQDAQPELMRFANVEKRYRDGSADKVALYPLSFTMADRAAIIAVVGQSGSGKTTLGNLMLGSTRPSSGRIAFQGRDVNHLSSDAAHRFRAGVQAVFQDPYSVFNPFYRVSHALAVPLSRFGIGANAGERRAAMEGACREVGLRTELLDRFPHELSGGQRQRMMIARILMLEPKLLVADEPVSMVDASLRSAILEQIRALKDRHGVCVIYITHDLTTAYQISDYVMVLLAGRVVEAGTPDEVIGTPRHPYTQLLVDSVPSPDPEKRWASDRRIEADLAILAQQESSLPMIRSQFDGLRLE